MNSRAFSHRVALGMVLFFAASIAHANPSFDCNKATTLDEKAICSDEVLSELDVLFSNAYSGYEPAYRSKKDVAKAILADRADCGDDKACIASVLSGALVTFGGRMSPWPDSYAQAMIGRKAAKLADDSIDGEMPTKTGQCSVTRISEVTTRFGEPVTYENGDAGTAISYENGLYQVSYSRDWMFYDAKAGQKAVVCLMEIPHDCPDGDERGRIFYTYSPETGTEWVLPDSQHMCGGA